LARSSATGCRRSTSRAWSGCTGRWTPAVGATLLGLDQVGATDSFFDVGGSSLQAMRLIGMMAEELQVDIGVADVFLAPTPRQLAALLRDEHGLGDAALEDAEPAGMSSE